MRVLVAVLGFIGVVGGASAGDLNSPFYESDAVAGRLVFETRFGGEHTAVAHRSFQLQFGTDRELHAGFAPLRAEYRGDTGQVLLNGVDLKPMLFSHQAEEGGITSAWGGWIPLAIVLTGVTFIAVDGRNNNVNSIVNGSGGA